MTRVVKHAPSDFHRYSLDLEGYDAARHLFRVAAGLESLMLGESEILGQMRTALEMADREAAAGPLLCALLRSAMRFGREVRVSTRIGSGALSVASASVQTLLHLRPKRSGMKVLVVGTGHTGYKVAQHLIAERAGEIVLINRTPERARRAAEELGATWAPFEDLEARMTEADAVFVAVQAAAPVVTAEMVRRAVAGRSVPLPILDLSLPRAVAAEVGDIPGAASFDLSRFEEVVAASRARRESEIVRVEALLDTALEKLEREAAEEAARPLVAELRVRAEAIRRAEVERAVAAGLGDAEVLDRVTRRVVDGLLRVPSAALRRGSQTRPRGGTCLQCVFGVRESSHGGD
jgi:glutamyl-tRNA reductase